jgi:hypothetical protein
MFLVAGFMFAGIFYVTVYVFVCTRQYVFKRVTFVSLPLSASPATLIIQKNKIIIFVILCFIAFAYYITPYVIVLVLFYSCFISVLPLKDEDLLELYLCKYPVRTAQ